MEMVAFTTLHNDCWERQRLYRRAIKHLDGNEGFAEAQFDLQPLERRRC
jgi:hypothetical protein